MQIPFLLSLGLLLHPASAPDKFWMSEAPDAAVIEGSLLDEDATHYHLRVQGSEIWLLKARVLRIEKDGLSVEAIAQREQEAKDAKAAADKVADERAAAERVAVEPTGEPPDAPAPRRLPKPVPAKRRRPKLANPCRNGSTRSAAGSCRAPWLPATRPCALWRRATPRRAIAVC